MQFMSTGCLLFGFGRFRFWFLCCGVYGLGFGLDGESGVYLDPKEPTFVGFLSMISL